MHGNNNKLQDNRAVCVFHFLPDGLNNLLELLNCCSSLFRNKAVKWVWKVANIFKLAWGAIPWIFKLLNIDCIIEEDVATPGCSFIFSIQPWEWSKSFHLTFSKKVNMHIFQNASKKGLPVHQVSSVCSPVLHTYGSSQHQPLWPAAPHCLCFPSYFVCYTCLPTCLFPFFTFWPTVHFWHVFFLSRKLQ